MFQRVTRRRHWLERDWVGMQSTTWMTCAETLGNGKKCHHIKTYKCPNGAGLALDSFLGGLKLTDHALNLRAIHAQRRAKFFRDELVQDRIPPSFVQVLQHQLLASNLKLS